MKPYLLFALAVAASTTVFASNREDREYLRHPTGYVNIDGELTRLNHKIIEGTEAERNLPLEFKLLLEANKVGASSII